MRNTKPNSNNGEFAPSSNQAHVSSDLAAFLTERLGETVTPEQASGYLASWARLFAYLARIDQRTGGKVGLSKQPCNSLAHDSGLCYPEPDDP